MEKKLLNRNKLLGPFKLKEMKANFKSVLCYLAIAGTATTFSCNKDDEQTPLQNAADIQEEVLTDLYYQDVDDLGSVAFDAATDAQYEGGRSSVTITVNDYRLCEGTSVSIVASGNKETPQGAITIDFGTAGCKDAKGNTRKGKVIFTYSGRRFVSGSTVVTTVDNYSINGIKLEGTRTSTNVTGSTEEAPVFHVELEDGVATFPDGSTATRESDIYWTWERAASPLNDKLIIDQGSSANGTTRAGTDYEITVLGALEYKRACPIATKGVKRYVLDGETEITVDYGDGECDRKIEVTTPRATRTITL